MTMQQGATSWSTMTWRCLSLLCAWREAPSTLTARGESPATHSCLCQFIVLLFGCQTFPQGLPRSPFTPSQHPPPPHIPLAAPPHIPSSPPPPHTHTHPHPPAPTMTHSPLPLLAPPLPALRQRLVQGLPITGFPCCLFHSLPSLWGGGWGGGGHIGFNGLIGFHSCIKHAFNFSSFHTCLWLFVSCMFMQHCAGCS